MTNRNVYALILAAGSGRRMGQLKQLLPYQDGTMLEAVIGAALESSLNGLVVAANPEVERFLRGTLPEQCHVVVNADPASDMLVSAQLGLAAIGAEFGPSDDDGVMVLLADQPQLTGGLVTTCAEAYRLPRRPPGILVAAYKKRRGHPTIFAFELMREIAEWPGSRKLSDLLEMHAEAVRELPITMCPMPIDVDTAEDYERLTRDPLRPDSA